MKRDQSTVDTPLSMCESLVHLFYCLISVVYAFLQSTAYFEIG